MKFIFIVLTLCVYIYGADSRPKSPEVEIIPKIETEDTMQKFDSTVCLPVELLLEIFMHLPKHEKLSFSMISHRVYHWIFDFSISDRFPLVCHEWEKDFLTLSVSQSLERERTPKLSSCVVQKLKFHSIYSFTEFIDDSPKVHTAVCIATSATSRGAHNAEIWNKNSIRDLRKLKFEEISVRIDHLEEVTWLSERLTDVKIKKVTLIFPVEFNESSVITFLKSLEDADVGELVLSIESDLSDTLRKSLTNVLENLSFLKALRLHGPSFVDDLVMDFAPFIVLIDGLEIFEADKNPVFSPIIGKRRMTINIFDAYLYCHPNVSEFPFQWTTRKEFKTVSSLIEFTKDVNEILSGQIKEFHGMNFDDLDLIKSIESAWHEYTDQVFLEKMVTDCDTFSEGLYVIRTKELVFIHSDPSLEQFKICFELMQASLESLEFKFFFADIDFLKLPNLKSLSVQIEAEKLNEEYLNQINGLVSESLTLRRLEIFLESGFFYNPSKQEFELIQTVFQKLIDIVCHKKRLRKFVIHNETLDLDLKYDEEYRNILTQ